MLHIRFSALFIAMVISASFATVTDLEVEISPSPSPLRIVYFHSPTCHECQRVKKHLALMMNKWGTTVTLELHSIDDIAEYNNLLKYESHYTVTVAAPPAIFVGTKALITEEDIIKKIELEVKNALLAGDETFSPPVTLSDNAKSGMEGLVPNEILARFDSFGPGAIAIAGLIDGVNPCAFTTIVFFLSMLAYLKKTRREMLIVGIAFTVGMFVAYFLLGLGLLGAVKSFSVSHGLSRIMAYSVAALAFALAAWSLVDAVRYKLSNDTQKVTLGLPLKIKQRIHKVIRTGLTAKGLVIGSLGVGFFVSILESFCTGQVYLPTIVFVTRSPGMRTSAIGYLLLYNIMFIIPLVAILAMAYMGVKSESLGNLLRERLVYAKVGMAVLFFGLSALIVMTM